MNRYIILFTCLLLAVFLVPAMSGCTSPVHPQSKLEKNWGRSYEAQLYLQTANPDAGKADPVLLMDGPASGHVMDEYRKSFSSENRKETVNIIKLR